MGAEPVVVLYASISVLNWMRAATGSQCKNTKRGVTWALLGSLKTSRAAAAVSSLNCFSVVFLMSDFVAEPVCSVSKLQGVQ